MAHDEIGRVLRDSGGVIRIRDHPSLARAAQRLAAGGRLRALLPGIYCDGDSGDLIELRIRAAAAWAPEAVLTGPAAARLTLWPEIDVPVITLSRPMRRAGRTGFRVCQERLPAELIMHHHGSWVTVPALTALDLVPWIGGQGIDDVLRTGVATLDTMWEALALTPRRAGNTLRRAALYDSRRGPWSAAERLLHRLLHRAGLRGWAGNVTVHCAGRSYPVDVAFRRRRVILEVDGYAFHRAENVDQFHRDRAKWSNLVADGWTVLHFTWDHLVYQPEWVLTKVRQALVLSRKLLVS